MVKQPQRNASEAPSWLTSRNGGDLPSRLTPRNGGRDGKSGHDGASSPLLSAGQEALEDLVAQQPAAGRQAHGRSVYF